MTEVVRWEEIWRMLTGDHNHNHPHHNNEALEFSSIFFSEKKNSPLNRIHL